MSTLSQAISPTPSRRSYLSMAPRSDGAVNDRVAAFLGPNVKVRGDVSFTGGLRIDGHVSGDVMAAGTDASILTIGDGGHVEGDVRVANLVVYGHIQGNVHATGLVDVRSQAVIVGDLHYHSLEVAQGSVILGRLHSKDKRSAA